MRAISLFANIGVAEAYLENIGINVVLANELLERRANLYSHIYPKTKMIQGDITDPLIFNQLVTQSLEQDVEIVMATPPCQGMSTAGQQNKNDGRNKLILPVLELIERVQPKYVFLENVPLFLNTSIEINNEQILIPNLIEDRLGRNYHIEIEVIDTQYYAVPQTRERCIILLTRQDTTPIWKIPLREERIIKMEDAIGHLPIVDPFIKDISYNELLEIFPHFEERKATALAISRWHNPPHHIKRQVIAMMHTPTGCTAFDNTIHFPVKENGEPVKGYRNTYKRQNWNTPAYTVTMDNRKISSQNNVHPGRLLGENNETGEAIYSDPRALTLYELMIISSLPTNWPIPDNASEAFIRSVIGEGIPPLFVKKTFEMLTRV